MTTWTAVIEWRTSTPLDATAIEELVEQLGATHTPAVRRVDRRTWAATVTVEAATIRQAIDRSMRLVEQAAHVRATGVEVLTTADSLRRTQQLPVARASFDFEDAPPGPRQP
jgi:hypothetical protein